MLRKLLFVSMLIGITGFYRISAQYDARKIKEIYGQLFRIELLTHQIQTDFVLTGEQIMPAESAEKKHRDEDAAKSALDSILIAIPADDKDLLHDFMRIKKQMDIALSSVDSGYNAATRRQSEKLFGRLRNHINLLQKKLLLLLSVSEQDLALLDRIRLVNENTEQAFRQYLVEGKKPGNLFKSAIKNLSKIRENFKKDKDLQFLITNMKSDLKTFDEAMKNGYKAGILYKPHEKFTRKILRLFAHIYGKIKVV